MCNLAQFFIWADDGARVPIIALFLGHVALFDVLTMLTFKPCSMVNATPDKCPTYIVALVAQLIYDQCFRPNDFIV